MEIAVPNLPARTGWAFDEVARRHGDYAMVGAAATVTLADDGTIATARLVYLSVGEYPTEAFQAEGMLNGEQPAADLIRSAAVTAAAQDINPGSDIHASAAYRRHLARVLAERVLARAVERANQTTDDGR